MKTNKSPIYPRAILLALFVALVTLTACTSQEEPVVVYVTPTSVPTETLMPAQTVNVAQNSLAETTSVPTTVMTVGALSVPSESPATKPQPTSSAATPLPPTPPPTNPPGVDFGAIVGPGYTIPPTDTRVPASPVPTTVPTAGPSPTRVPGLHSDLIGLQIHANIDSQEFARALGHARALKVRWLKIQFNWALLEYAPNHYTDLFYGVRGYVQQAHNEGFKVMVSVAKAPDWTRSPDANGQYQEHGPPDDPQQLGSFMSTMLNMIGRDSAGQPYIDAIEVWNEPNLQREWFGHELSGASYMQYFKPAYTAIRQFSPTITIITAAPAPTGNSPWSTNDRTWLQQLYNAGLGSYGADVQVGIHPYGWANPPDARCCSAASRGWDDQPQFFFLDTIEDYRKIMVNNGHSAAQLWTTEFGWPTFDGLTPASGGPPPPPPQDESYFGYIDQWQQADFTLRAFDLGQERDYMGPMMLWNLNFSTVPNAVENGDKKTGYSLLTGQWQPRPVYDALLKALAG